MKKTCRWCGRVVDEDHKCPQRKDYRNKNGKDELRLTKFRNSKAWSSKSVEIRERDRYLCKVCLADRYNTLNVLNYKKLEVHHIVPMSVDYEKRLDNDNLITLCSYHHHMAEKGKIPKEELLELVKVKI